MQDSAPSPDTRPPRAGSCCPPGPAALHTQAGHSAVFQTSVEGALSRAPARRRQGLPRGLEDAHGGARASGGAARQHLSPQKGRVPPRGPRWCHAATPDLILRGAERQGPGGAEELPEGTRPGKTHEQLHNTDPETKIHDRCPERTRRPRTRRQKPVLKKSTDKHPHVQPTSLRFPTLDASLPTCGGGGFASDSRFGARGFLGESQARPPQELFG